MHEECTNSIVLVYTLLAINAGFFCFVGAFGALYMSALRHLKVNYIDTEYRHTYTYANYVSVSFTTACAVCATHIIILIHGIILHGIS